MDPFAKDCIFGPLANKTPFERYVAKIRQADKHCEILVASKTLSGGAFVTPSVHFRSNKPINFRVI